MSEVRFHSCDACGKEAPDGHSHVMAKGGWYAIGAGPKAAGRRGRRAYLDACSPECLVVIALKERGVSPDELEAMFALPSDKADPDAA